MSAPGLPVAGMLLIDKPAGWTSHDCVAVLRKLFPKNTKVGHTGTLDPLATGLLVALVGPCTKLQARLQGMDKTYSGTIRLGESPPMLVVPANAAAPANRRNDRRGSAFSERSRSGIDMTTDSSTTRRPCYEMGLARISAGRFAQARR